MTNITKNITLDIFSLDKLTAAIDSAVANIPARDTRIWALDTIVRTTAATAIASGYLRESPAPTINLNQNTQVVTLTAYTTGKTPHYIEIQVS